MANRIPLVYIVSDEKPLTQELGEELVGKSCKVIFINKYEDLTEIPDYFFILLGFSINEIFTKQQINKFLDFAQASRAKGEVILPYVASNFEYVRDISGYAKDKKLQIVYLGDLFGERVPASFEAFWNKDKISVPIYNYNLYLLHIDEAVKFLIKGAFSYGFDKKEVVLAHKEDVFSFIKRLQELLPKFKFEIDRLVVQKPTQPVFEFVPRVINNEDVSKTLSWLAAQRREITSPKLLRRKEKRVKRPKIKINIKFGRFLKVFVVLFWIISTPFLALFLSSMFLKVGFERLTNDDLVKSNVYFEVSNGLARISSFGFFMFDSGKNASSTISNMDIAGEQAISILKTQDFGQIYLQTDLLYQETAFLAANPDTTNFLPKVNFKEISFYLENIRKIVKSLSGNYLVLVLDPNELRPTGGKIKMVGVISLENGGITNQSFFDSETIDKQLRGYVSPPVALQKYLGLTNWDLSNSNWDPDFTVSGAKAEWFFENETGEKIDGVMNINLDTYNEVKEFKGSNLRLWTEIFKNLSDKNMQIFSDNPETESAFTDLNWDGGLGGSNYIGLVEANLGGNKINNQVTRSAKLTINSNGAVNSYKLEVEYVNSSAETYKNYLRVITNDEPEMGFYLQVPGGKSDKATFNWTDKSVTTLRLRKQPGVDLMPTSIVINGATRYNTNLTTDFLINL